MTYCTTRREHRARDERIAALRAIAEPTSAEHAELTRLEHQRDCAWRQLPRRIDAARHRLAQLLAHADEIGLGPC